MLVCALSVPCLWITLAPCTSNIPPPIRLLLERFGYPDLPLRVLLHAVLWGGLMRQPRPQHWESLKQSVASFERLVIMLNGATLDGSAFAQYTYMVTGLRPNNRFLLATPGAKLSTPLERQSGT